MIADIVFIHGMFMNPKSWQKWMDYFAVRGFQCHSPAWPCHQGEPAELRQSPPAGLGSLTLTEVLDHHRRFLAELGGKPVLIGHSVGGLITQKLINEDRAMAGVAINSAPPAGIFLPKWSFFKANLPVVNPFAGDQPFQFSLEQFQYAFCNTMSLDETRQVYESLVVPESRNVARAVAGPEARIDFAKAHPPILLIGGEKDHIVPWRLNHKNYKAYLHPSSQRTFKLFPGRSHYICGQTDWQEIAEFVYQWLKPMI